MSSERKVLHWVIKSTQIIIGTHPQSTCDINVMRYLHRAAACHAATYKKIEKYPLLDHQTKEFLPWAVRLIQMIPHTP